MIADWIKNENDIYNRKKDEIDDLRKNYYHFLKTGKLLGRYRVYGFRPDVYINIPSEIEKKDSNLKHISIVIGNWERYYYIPLVLEMWHNQDYPKNLLEIIIVDDDSADKAAVLNTIKEQVKLYPDLKIRFIQNYINKTKSGAGRMNIGARHASHNIIIIQDSDQVPLGSHYLRGICYTHNRFHNASCIPMAIWCQSDGHDLDDLHGVMNRLEHQYLTSFNRTLLFNIRGYDEKRVGWGGHEGNIIRRYVWTGGKVVMNTTICGGALPNFPIPPSIPPWTKKTHKGTDWQNLKKLPINDENWGLSKKMEEINLYQ